MTLEAPRAFADKSVTRPIHPAPRITTDCPRDTPPRLVACRPTASGSTSAPSIVDTFSGSLKHISAGCETYSFSAPATGGAAKNFISGQRLYLPDLQNSHLPQA